MGRERALRCGADGWREGGCRHLATGLEFGRAVGERAGVRWAWSVGAAITGAGLPRTAGWSPSGVQDFVPEELSPCQPKGEMAPKCLRSTGQMTLDSVA